MKACRDNKKGIVDFVDAGYDLTKPEDRDHSWGGVGFWKQEDIKRHFGEFGLDKYIRIYVMKSEEFLEKFPKRKWEYIYIDGDHSYKGVRQDFELCWPRLKSRGFMGFHDIYIKEIGGCSYGVRKLWQELKSQSKYGMIELRGFCGLGIIQK